MHEEEEEEEERSGEEAAFTSRRNSCKDAAPRSLSTSSREEEPSELCMLMARELRGRGPSLCDTELIRLHLPAAHREAQKALEEEGRRKRERRRKRPRRGRA